MRSDPVILESRRQEYCSRCNTKGDHWTIACPQKKPVAESQLGTAENLESEVQSFIIS